MAEKIIEHHELECKSGGSDKFYKLRLVHRPNVTKSETFFVEIHWGRNGTAGQKESKPYNSEHAAAQYMNQRLKDKENKGYKHVQGSPFVTNSSRNVVNTTQKVKVAYVETDWDLL